MAKSEAWHQVMFFGKCAERAHVDDRYKDIYAIPNGGLRDKITAARMVAEGARKGVPDVFVAVPEQGMCGLYIEFKKKGNPLSADQKDWRGRLHRRKYGYYVAYTCDEALNLLARYLGAASTG